MGVDQDASSSSHALVPSGAGDGDISSSSPLLAPSNLSSQPKTFANVFIAIVGAGVLGLPYTFMRTGWATGVIMLLVVGALTFYCMLLLLRIRRRLDATSKITSFGDLGFAVSGNWGRVAVDLMIVLSQAGFCVGYLIFIANTLTHLVSRLSKPLTIWSVFPFQLALNSAPSLTHLAPLSIFADVVDIAAMGVVLVEDVAFYFTARPSLTPFGPPSVLLYGLGVAIYAFEGIGMILPLEYEAADKDSFPRTLGLSMAFISMLYGLFGAMGYFAFGDETRDIITTNFGRGVVSLLIQLGLCINLFFTLPIMMQPVFEVAERWVTGKKYCIWLRWALVLAVSLVALFVPNFADFLSVVGSSVCCLLGFVLPAVFHLRVFGQEMGWLEASVDLAIAVIGIVFAIYGTYSSLMDIFYSVKV